MIFYHNTEKRDLKNILKNGLQGFYDKKIYLTDTIELAKNWQGELMYNELPDFTGWIILEIDLPKNKVKQGHYKPYNKIHLKEFTYKGYIRPEKIKIIK